MVEYELSLEIDLGKSIPDVGRLIEGVNANLSTIGVDERLGVRSHVGTMTVKNDKELSQQELQMLREETERVLRTRFPEFGYSVGQPRRKSGNVQQSAS